MGAQFVNVTAVHVKLRHEQTVGDQRFFCPEAQDGLRKVPWVIWESNQYYVPRLFMLREFWATKLRLWFPDVSRVFTQLGRVLCVPRNAVWHTIRRVHEGEMAWGAAKAQVGIQVRRHGVSENASFSEEVYRRIVECVVAGGVVPPPMATTPGRPGRWPSFPTRSAPAVPSSSSTARRPTSSASASCFVPTRPSSVPTMLTSTPMNADRRSGYSAASC